MCKLVEVDCDEFQGGGHELFFIYEICSFGDADALGKFFREKYKTLFLINFQIVDDATVGSCYSKNSRTW